MGVEYYLVCIREGLLFEKGMESPRGHGRLSGIRETQLFLLRNQGNRVDYTVLIICGHKLQCGQDVPVLCFVLFCFFSIGLEIFAQKKRG